MNPFARSACLAIVVGLTAFLVYAFATGSVVGDQLHTWETVWGIYVWADAYSGFLIMATLIYAYERNFSLTLALFLLTCCTGNMVNAAWLLWRAPEIYQRIAHKPPRTPA
jgi:hypothetical protein